MSTKRREYEYGRLVSVDLVTLGGSLAADASSGASSITVEDASDFDEDGGQLLLNGAVYTYSTWTEDEATGVCTITLTGTTLAANATEGTTVAVYDPLYATAATEKVCQFEVVGDDGNTDTYEATLALHLVDKVDEGVRGLNAEQVKVELEGDEYVIVDILGLGDPNASGTLAMQDLLTVAATGAQTLLLTFEPIPNSEHLYWNGLYQPGSHWTRSGQSVSIPDSPSGSIAVGDELVMEYLYRKGTVNAPVTDTPANIADLRIWLSADDLAAQGFTNGQQVTTWRDIGGIGAHATGQSATGGSLPVFRPTGGPGGGPCVEFNPGYFSWASSPFTGSAAEKGFHNGLTAAEVFIGIKMDTENSKSSVHYLHQANNDMVHYRWDNNEWDDNFGSTTRRTINSPPSVTSWRRYNIHSAPNDWAAKVDETVYKTDASNTVGFGQASLYNLGYGYVPPGPLNGKVTMFIMYARKLTTDERARVIAFMQAHPSGGLA